LIYLSHAAPSIMSHARNAVIPRLDRGIHFAEDLNSVKKEAGCSTKIAIHCKVDTAVKPRYDSLKKKCHNIVDDNLVGE